jgi:hypothetical protein
VPLAAGAANASQNGGDHKITLCHPSGATIMPAFDHSASPRDEKSGSLSHYAALNNGAQGQVLANGCEGPGPPDAQPEPCGSLARCRAVAASSAKN